ncbi:MAG: hypothetical protein K2K80_04175 [Clostridia bacterium]|nr:hypothetical protein [Clostridia bacterium]
MDNKNLVDDAAIIDYVKSTNLKGKISFENYGFIWDLGSLSLIFICNSGEMQIEYCKRKNKLISIGHLHVDNEDVIDMINEINREDKMVKITTTFLGSTFEIVDKDSKRKKSWFLFRSYYSC